MADQTLIDWTKILRRDFVAFAERAYNELYPSKTFENNWHIELMAEKLEAVRKGEIKRLIINQPPGTMKSFLGSMVFPAFVLGHRPSTEFLCISYGQGIANDLAGPCRSLMQSPFYKSLFGPRLSDDQQAVENFTTIEGGARRAVSFGGAITGRGADFVVIDDPLKADEAYSASARNRVNTLYQTSVVSRLRRDSSAVVILMQRLHANDLTGFVQKNDDWEVLTIPAISLQRQTYRIRTPYGDKTVDVPEGQALQSKVQSLEFLRRQRKTQGELVFDAQFQQKPHDSEKAIIKREWLVPYDENSKPEAFDRVLQSWDTTLKGGEDHSYNACTTWGIRNGHYYLLRAYRDQADFDILKPRAIAMARAARPVRILIEDQAFGRPLAREMQALDLDVQLVAVGITSKIERLAEHIDKFSDERVHVPADGEFIEDYIEELTTFPDSPFNDWVDSTSQALAHDLSKFSFDNAIGAVKLLGGEVKSGKKVRFEIVAPSGILTFNDGVRKDIKDAPQRPGDIWEVDEDLANILNLRPFHFRRLPD